MPLDDDLDKRFAGYTVQHGLAPAALLEQARSKAHAAGQAASAVVIQTLAPPARPPLLAILRFLHAGFPATEEDALDRHEDRLVARLALKSGSLDEATLRGAIAEQDSLRAQGTMKRLGEILVARGKVDAPAAERLYRYLENAIVLCEGCFATTPRQGLEPGQRLACHRCGGELVVPGAEEKPEWVGERTVAVGAPSDIAVPSAAKAVAEEAEHGDSQFFPPGSKQAQPPEPAPIESAAMKGTAKPKRVRPKLAPAQPVKVPLKKKLGAFLAFAVPASIVLPLVFWAIQKNGVEEDFASFQADHSMARKRKKEGEFPMASSHYADAVKRFAKRSWLWLPLVYKANMRQEVEAAIAEQKAVDDFLVRLKDDQGGDKLGELVNATDQDVLCHLGDVLSTKKGEKVGEALAALARNADPTVKKHTYDLALKLGPEAAPALEVFMEPETDDEKAKAAAKALAGLAGKKGQIAETGLGAVEKAIARFGQVDTQIVMNLAESIVNSKDKRAVEIMKKLAHDKRASVSEAALKGLANSGATGITDELIIGLDSPESIQRPCLEALKKQGSSAIGALESALAGGQETALLGLVALGPEAENAFLRSFPKLGWVKRGSALSTVKGLGYKASFGKSVIQKIGEEALAEAEKLESGKPVEKEFNRVVLAQVGDGAEAFGLADLALRLRVETRFAELIEQKPGQFTKALDAEPLDDANAAPFVIIKNRADGEVRLWFKGPKYVVARALPEKGKDADRQELVPGSYKVIADMCPPGSSTPEEVRTTELEILPGKRYSVTFGGD